ncbi:hypothetical protein [Hymenobacter sp. HDW8]|uniref:hypothetical protein n=1 Tax=Hymenobacter sp. HDW8 TaxID=2714932 RepID=UPI00140804F0|nr:hypothetical protein [Hymenobacter sp. HDW8]QIL77705.1 hypothetical protein G7064_19080 [Hymenobacter sp. HDW8]
MSHTLRQRCGPVLLICFLSLSISAFSQKKKPLPGYVVTTGGDTLLGAIYPTDPLLQQIQVEFLTVQGNQRLTLDGYQLASYTYFKDQDTIRYISFPFLQNGSTKPNRGFLQQLITGEAQLYYYSAHDTGPTPMPNNPNVYFYIVPQKNSNYPLFTAPRRRGLGRNPARSFVIYRENQDRLAHTNAWKFPKDAVTYFSECPELVADLKSRRYRYRDIPQIVRRYNAWFQTQKPTP